MPIHDEKNVSIRINNNFEDSYKITLYNILGQQVGTLFEDNIESGVHDISITDQFPHLKTGVYVYNINKNYRSYRNYSKKVIISG